MLVNESLEDFSSFFSNFTSFFNDDSTFTLLTDSKLELESDCLMGNQVKYQNGTDIVNEIITKVLPFHIFCMKLDDGSIVETHRNFISFYLQQNKPEKFSEPLVSKISDQIAHKASLGIPTQNKTLSDDQQELLLRHYRLGHMPFQFLQKLANLGLIPQH